MPEPLKGHTLEARPKRVHQARSYRATIDLAKEPQAAQALLEIRRCITNGFPIPEGYYRLNRATTPDELLQELGVMHLHLGHPGTRALLYLVEFEDDVVFLEISDHVHVDVRPIGTVMRGLHKLPPLDWHEERKAKVAKAMAALMSRKKE